MVDHGPAAITDALTDFFGDLELQERLATGAREYGEAHDWERIVADLERVYRDVLAG